MKTCDVVVVLAFLGLIVLTLGLGYLASLAVLR